MDLIRDSLPQAGNENAPKWHLTALKAFGASMGCLILLGVIFGGDSGRVIQTIALGPVLLFFSEDMVVEGFNPIGILCLSGWCCLTAWRLKGFWVYLLSIAWVVGGFAFLLRHLVKNMAT